MDKQQQVEYNSKTKAYIEQNKLRQLFYTLTKSLAQHQPTDPFQYLIEHLENRKNKRVVYIQGFNTNIRNQIASTVANKFNFKLLNICEILKVKDINVVSDDTVNNAVKEHVNKVESVYKGIVVCGYPNNLIQAFYLQKNLVNSERIFILKHDVEQMETFYLSQGHTKQVVQKYKIRDILNLKQLKDHLKDIPDYLNTSQQQSLEIITATLKVKDRKKIPIESPRIMVLHPPYLQPSVVSNICVKYSLNHISLQKAFLKLKNRKQQYEQYARKHNHLTKQLQLALIETECTSIISKSKGILLSGWPNDKSKWVFTSEHYINPHIILIFSDDRQKCVKQFNQLDASHVETFAVNNKPTQEQFREQLAAYDELITQLKSGDRVVNFSSKDSVKDILRGLDIAISNPKLYS